MKSFYFLLIFMLGMSSALVAQNTPLVEGNGIQISEEEVLEAAQDRLEGLELEELRFEAEQKKKRHQILESSMKELLADRLLQLEAESQNKSKDELVAEVNADLAEPTAEEVDAFYEARKSRLKQPKEELEPQIRAYLKQQRSQKAFVEYMEELAGKYGVEYNLPPLRFEVESEGHPSLGPEDASVTVVEFSDFQCPYCARMGPALKRLASQYEGQVRLVFRQYPLTSIHPDAGHAARASLCASEQEMFWEMHDRLFADQKAFSVPELKATAVELGMDGEAFSACIDSEKYKDQVREDVRDAMTVGVTGTPAFFINGRPLSGAVPYEELTKMVEEELAKGAE